MRPSLITQIPVPVLALTAALILPLAACNKAPEVSATNATQKEVAEKVAAANAGGTMIEPGRWEGSMTMHEMDMPGLPPEVKAQMKKQLSTTHNFVNCVTEEDVKNQKALYTGDDKNCKYDHFTLGGGKIDAVMTCNRGDGGKMAMTMTGDYASGRYHMDMTTRAEGAGPMGSMTMKMSVDAKRVGACRGTKDEL